MLLPPLLLLPLLWAGVGGRGERLARWWPPRLDPHPPSTSKPQALDSIYSIHLEPQVMVQEGQCVLVPCVIVYTRIRYMERDLAHGYWFKQRRRSWGTEFSLVATNNPAQPVQKETRGRFHLVGDPQAHNCSLDIRDARRADAGTYVFRLEREAGVKYDYPDYPLSVTVTALTQTPHIQFPGTLRSGHPSTIICSAPWACPRGTPPTFSWTGVAVPSGGTDSPVLSLTPEPQHHGTSLTCRVSFPGAGVSTERTMRLSVAYAPQNLTIWLIRKEGSGPTALGNGSALPVQEGQSLRLVCVVDSRPPASLSWVQGSLTVKSSASLSAMEAGGMGEHSQSLELELPSVHLDDHGPFLCRAQHPLGSQEASLHLSVQKGRGPVLQLPLQCLVSPLPVLAAGGAAAGENSSGTSIQVTFSYTGSWAYGSLSLHGQLSSNLRLSWSFGARTGVAVGGAGVTALLALCLVFFLVRSRRRRRAEGAVSWASPRAAGRTGSDSGGPLNGSGAAIPSGSSGPAARSPSEKEQELDYASLSFHKGKRWNLQAQETTEYSAIKI